MGNIHNARATFRCAFRLLAAAALALFVASFAEAAWEGELPTPQGEVLLRVSGSIAISNRFNEAHFDRGMIKDLPRHTLKTRTAVTDGVDTFEGFLVRDLLYALGAEGDTVTATALNDYVIDIPYSDFERFDVMAAFRMNGEELTPRDKGPLWIVYPRDDFPELQDIRYDYRWVWQLVHLKVR